MRVITSMNNKGLRKPTNYAKRKKIAKRANRRAVSVSLATGDYESALDGIKLTPRQVF